MENTPLFSISMLGEFSISYKNNTIRDINNRSKKPWNLLEYLIIFRNKEISQNELIELLWDGDSSDNPVGALKVLLHRVRKSLEELQYDGDGSMIVQRHGTYAWNRSLNCVIDIDVFERLCEEADNTELPDDDRILIYQDAFRLYKGDFLPRNNHESWVVPISVYYHSLYIKSVHNACDLLSKANRNNEIEQICTKALKVEALDEKLHYRLIQALYLSGKQQEAINQYNDVTDMFFSKFGITPSMELKALYRDIVKTNNSLEMDLNTIMDELKEPRQADGAFYCEYEFFKDIYQLESRACARSGDSIYLCLMTLNAPPSSIPKQKFINRTMDDLKQCINSALRRGDLYSRYSVTQFIILLPTTSYENGRLVLERILNLFHKKYTRKNVNIQYKLQPLEPTL